MTNQTQPQDGFRFNSQGHQVPVSQIKDVDLLRDDVVADIVKKAIATQETLALFKKEAMQNVADFVDLSSAEFDVKYGGTKGNVTLLSFDGKYKVQRSIGEHRVFDERIQAAKAIIDECINRWNENSSDEIKALVDLSFRVNKQGHIDVNQVLSLRQLNITDPDWLEAMDAIADSIKVIGKTPYLRIYERQGDGQYKQIALDIAKL
ncbi:hypothetical protein NVP1028O_07 [Vibrio phage 1.028.O._10N.286.45.B6]|nr:hypothetical protein NVP1028O_07 [Vibrio phage 1.028.O._10N.286.45.B6]AUR90011.1 protein of unknown function DUF3164 [Vibrio phage 1.136.O._10N.261.45.E11]AUR90329.1 hypothetical protein NVP1142O_07 [Vibrio phage 1.142.O._10N.261.49.E11]AUR91125.1 hypothetical protein NVP1156O_07 [Vibrio phage 1.156.O._10N.261.45.A6]AUR91306.1 hypothetical protein NVP1159O_07 [Vibrio phage 1.159.O._10N.261.46.F12]AUR96204.1 hypothetical protein NVP1217O_07 [Vibrio phage 1.217.O._10N.261.45.A1]AUR96254.1 hy